MFRFLAVLTGLAAALAAEISPLAIPQFADGGGWKSTMAVFNTFGVDAARLRINFRNREGQIVPVPLEGYGPTGSLEVELPTQRSLFLTSTGAAAVTQSGWVEIVQLSGSTPVRAYVVFRQVVPGRPDFEAFAVGMRAAAGMTFPFDNTDGLVTSFAVVNLGVSDCAIGVSPIIDEAGNSLSTPGRVAANVAPNGHAAFVSTDRLPEIAGKRGYLKFYPAFGCTGGIAMVGLRFNSTGPFTNMSPLEVNAPF